MSRTGSIAGKFVPTACDSILWDYADVLLFHLIESTGQLKSTRDSGKWMYLMPKRRVERMASAMKATIVTLSFCSVQGRAAWVSTWCVVFGFVDNVVFCRSSLTLAHSLSLNRLVQTLASSLIVIGIPTKTVRPWTVVIALDRLGLSQFTGSSLPTLSISR